MRKAMLVGLLAFGSLAGPLCVLSGYDLAAQYVDDAFYYFQIARHVAHGLGPTFDGLHATNGFHPLWLMVLVPIFGAVPGLDEAVRVAGLCEAGFVACGAALMYRGLAARRSRQEALLAALLTFAMPGTRGVLRTGLEGALVFVLLVLVWHAWLRWKDGAPRALLQLGACVALLALARLECTAFMLALAFWERRVLFKDRRALALLVLPTSLALSVYIGFNLARFGIPLPVSGMVKHAAHARRGMSTSLWTLLLAAAALAAIAYGIRARAPELAARLSHSGAGWLLLGAAAVFGADLLSLGGLQSWYWVPVLPGLAIALASVVRRYQLLMTLASASLVVAALARVPHAVRVTRHTRMHAHIRGEAADALRALVPAGTPIGAWNGGMLGYYSKLPVVMLDGLANDAAFYRRVVEKHDLAGYLADEHIRTLAVTSCKLVWVARELSPAIAAQLERRVVKRAALARDPSTDPCHAYSLWELAQPLVD
ncbi:MAG TPA: hypothetical protein VFN67_29695 [Polyangiales bacterium]|nr:hypothetical protein [Polyangiales bacterium]